MQNQQLDWSRRTKGKPACDPADPLVQDFGFLLNNLNGGNTLTLTAPLGAVIPKR